MGKWEEVESEPVSVPGVSPVMDNAHRKPAMLDEIDGPPAPLVEIPFPLWKIVARLAVLLLPGSYAAVLVWASRAPLAPSGLRRGRRHRPVGLSFLRLRRGPEFAVGNDGICSFDWEEVTSCRWWRVHARRPANPGQDQGNRAQRRAAANPA